MYMVYMYMSSMLIKLAPPPPILQDSVRSLIWLLCCLKWSACSMLSLCLLVDLVTLTPAIWGNHQATSISEFCSSEFLDLDQDLDLEKLEKKK